MKIVNIINSVSRFCGYIATTTVVLMMLLTVSDVFMRTFFNSPIMGTTEISEALMVVVAFLGISWCAMNRTHIKVDLVIARLPPRWQGVVDGTTMLLALGTYIVIAWRSFLEAAMVKSKGGVIGLPDAPFYWLLSFGVTMLCLVMIPIIIENFTKAVKG